MTSVFGRSGKRFSIDDAFEEENDEAIKIYGSTTERSPLNPKNRNLASDENVIVRIDDTVYRGNVLVHIDDPVFRDGGRLKLTDDTLSRDSDSLMHDNGYYTGIFDSEQSCWRHPKIRENWKMVLAATILLIIGIGLLTTGVLVVFLPNTGLQGLVFFIAGSICFIPGAYHVIYLYLAVKGRQGYDFYHLPLFN